MNTTHTPYRHRPLATRVWTIVTLVVALAASTIPLAAESIAARMTEAMQGTDGKKGWLLMRGTTVLASQNPSYVFEPASTIKFLHHLHAELMIQANWISPATPISGTNVYNGSCPVDSPNQWTEPLEDAQSKMMWASDNSRTEAIKDQFGAAAINNTAQFLGAANTNLKHTIGCGAEALANPNETTLTDMTTLYRKAFTGNLLTAERRQHMWARMPNSPKMLKDLAQWEAVWSYGQVLTGAPQDFKDNLKLAWKPGGYTVCSVGCKYYRSIAGYAEIPFQTIYGIVSLKYTFGIFVDKATMGDEAARKAIDEALPELFREEINKALGTFF